MKIIFKTDALNEAKTRKSCQCAVKAGADFIKTNTGFLTGFETYGATPEVIRIMMEEVGDKCRIKGCGNIRTIW